MPLSVRTTFLGIALAALLAGCGSDIGDSCSISSDCSPTGKRICDPPSNTPGGYCTIRGCDYDTCPNEAVCVRFFPVTQTDVNCSQDSDCTPDELCTLGGFCVPRSAEVRYCMRKCGGNGDCRDGYECRDESLMVDHGGEPVLDPSKPAPDTLQAFCATTTPKT